MLANHLVSVVVSALKACKLLLKLINSVDASDTCIVQSIKHSAVGVCLIRFGSVQLR